MTSLDRRGDVFVLDLGSDENRFNPTWVGSVEQALSEVEAVEGPRALVTTGTGKFWSNGLDLDWMSANPEAAIVERARNRADLIVLASSRRGVTQRAFFGHLVDHVLRHATCPVAIVSSN